ncbi:MAG: protein deglycase HchA [Cyclobacteriaceae bacterium]|nr:protein deglycase HchA [Cyclobacteriaceae bacterium]
MIKKLFGLNPNPTEDGAYSPSSLSLKLATSDTTDYTPIIFSNPNRDRQLKILVVCTEQSQLTMTNGKKFSTGNHPVETLVPMLHLKNAGFDFDIFTPTGKPVQLEMWAMPKKDKNVMAIYDEYKSHLDKPNSIADFAKNNFDNNRSYIAIYIPGGHGALIGLPDDKNVGDLIKWAFKKDLFNLSICHGPAALLAAKPANDTEPFIFNGYKIAAFPDKVDRQTPLIGYMPGQLTWFFGEKLNKLGVRIVNSKADKTCFADRKLITGASPKAANEFGKLSATKLLEFINGQTNK